MSTIPLVDLEPSDPDHWVVVNEEVTGSHTHGVVDFEDDHLVLHGEFENDGANSTSVRSRSLLAPLKSLNGIGLLVRGDGREYHCDLRVTPTDDGPTRMWTAVFETMGGKVSEVRLPFAAFKAADGSNPAETFPDGVGSIGFTLADGHHGEFRLEVLAVVGY